MLILSIENMRLMFCVLFLLRVLHLYKMYIKMKITKIFSSYLIYVCLELLYWLVMMYEMLLAMCFLLLFDCLICYMNHSCLSKIKPVSTPVFYIKPSHFWKNSNKTASFKPRYRRTFKYVRRTFSSESSQRNQIFFVMLKQIRILTYMFYMRLLECKCVFLTDGWKN